MWTHEPLVASWESKFYYAYKYFFFFLLGPGVPMICTVLLQNVDAFLEADPLTLRFFFFISSSTTHMKLE